jgi:hypothetical protein
MELDATTSKDFDATFACIRELYCVIALIYWFRCNFDASLKRM